MLGLTTLGIFLLCALVALAGFHLYRTNGFKGAIVYTEGLLTQAKYTIIEAQDLARVSRIDLMHTKNELTLAEKELAVMRNDSQDTSGLLETANRVIFNLRSEVRELANAPKVRYQNAEEALRDILDEGPVTSTKALSEMEARGYSESSTYTAKSALSVLSKKLNSDWVWLAPGQSCDQYLATRAEGVASGGAEGTFRSRGEHGTVSATA